MSDNEISIDETCSCGASLHIGRGYHIYVRQETKAWRQDHRHEMPQTPASAPVSDSGPLTAPTSPPEPPLVPGVRGARMGWDAEPTPGATGDLPR